MRIELDILFQVEFVGDAIQIAFVLRLSGIMLLPVPLLLEFL